MRWLGLIALAFAAGCSGQLVADIEVNQGRASYAALANQIEPGMTAAQVRELLGPPQSRWNLDEEVWLYYYQSLSTQKAESYTLQISFAERKVSAVQHLQEPK